MKESENNCSAKEEASTATSLLGKPQSNLNLRGSNVSFYRLVFNHFDRNRDGKISPAELQSCVRNAGGELSAEEAEEAVSAVDLDGDGQLGLEEFRKLMEYDSGGDDDDEDRRKDLRDAFKMYEMEGSGYITAVSLKRMLSRLGESKSIDDCNTMIRAFDLDGDGVLNFDEFSLMLR